MTHDRFTSGDRAITDALRALYAAPAGDRYWEGLEARVLARIARGGESGVWWAELGEMMRPGLLAAAALVLAASLAMMRSHRLEASNAYASVTAVSPTAAEQANRGSSSGDGDMALHYLLSR